MKIGFLQFQTFFGDQKRNFDKIYDLVSSSDDADIIVLPELCLSGYLFLKADNLDNFSEDTNGKYFNLMKDLSNKKNAALAFGFSEKYNGKYYNSQAFVTPEGNFYIYRKIHLFDREKLFFEPGDIKPKVFEFRGAKLGQLVCFDWFFPEIYRTYFMQNVEIICHSTNLVMPYCQKASYTRAIENRIFLVISNKYGIEERNDYKVSFTGNSIIYDPFGNVLAEASKEEESVHIVEISPKIAQNKNISENNNLFKDRRPEMYL